MKRLLLSAAMVACAMLGTMRQASAHCEVPCGIYADQLRFQQMLEDCQTIEKAMGQIAALAAEVRDQHDPLAVNQVARWVATKESHATNTQHIIAQYFMTQRIKADADGYVKKLTAAHAVMVGAMKCKQTVDTANTAALKKAILDFYRAYEGKEPALHD